MNKTKIILITIVIILIGFGVLYGLRTSVQTSSNNIIENKENIAVTSTSTTYVSESGDEAQVTYYSNDTAIFTLSNSEYQNIPFTIAISASGARYENIEQGLVLWEKAPEITILKNDQVIFSGSLEEELNIPEVLILKKWIWAQTRYGSDYKFADNVLSPIKKDLFTLTFTEDGRVSGTTDCNNFNGTYTLEGNKIKFGSFISTLMYCEGSQEQEFLGMIKDGRISITNDKNQLSIDLEGAVVIFDGE